MKIFRSWSNDKKEKEATPENKHDGQWKAESSKRGGRTISSPSPEKGTEGSETERSTDSDTSQEKMRVSFDESKTIERRRSRHTKKKNSKRHPGSSRHQPSAIPSEPSENVDANPFFNKGEVYLGSDMAYVADAIKLDLNTQVMLAYYDAKSLEDFCLMAEADLKDLISKAAAMRRALPPLQIRKIKVLRKWVQEVSESSDGSRLPAWVRLSQPKRYKRKTGELIPKDWRTQFKRDLPRLKATLKEKAENMSPFRPFGEYAPASFRTITMCGLVD